MNNLDGFLKKFKSALGIITLEKKLISEEISGILGIHVSEKSTEVKNNIVVVNGGASLKSQIFLKKNKILESFKKHPELQKIKDIR